MEKFRVGFTINRGVVIKSQKTGIAAKVNHLKDGTEFVEFICEKEENELFQEEMKKFQPKKIIAIMIIIYAMIFSFFCLLRGKAGIWPGVYLTVLTCTGLYELLQEIIYAIRYKSYGNILKRLEKLKIEKNDIDYKTISEIKFVSDNRTLDDIRMLIFIFSVSIVILFGAENNFKISIIIAICLYIVYLISLKNKKLIKFLQMIEKALVYRNAKKEQIQLVLFGLQFLEKHESDPEIVNWYYQN